MQNKFYQWLTVLGCSVYASQSFSQDPHFSQYYASPATVNPATTGLFDGTLRASSLFRHQWAAYGSPFTTTTAALELKPGTTADQSPANRFGVGLFALADKTPGNTLQTHHLQLTVAYHKTLDENGYHLLSAGFMGGYGERWLDVSGLSFGNQFNGDGFDHTMASGETFLTGRRSNWDAQAGGQYTYMTEEHMAYLGFSVFHLIQPRNNFLSYSGSDVFVTAKRYNLSSGFNLQAGNGLRYAGSLLLMQQGQARELTGGGAVGIPFSADAGVLLYLGAWARWNDAVIPTFNLQWGTVNLGLSYDVAVGSKTFTKPRSFELSLVWVRPATYKSRTTCFAF